MVQKKGWTNADYRAVGKVAVLLRLDERLAKKLFDVADHQGVSRQALIERLIESLPDPPSSDEVEP